MTTTVALRAVEQSDLPLLLKWRNDIDVRDGSYQIEPISMARQEMWFEGLLESEDFLFIIETKSDGAVGTVGLSSIDWRNRRAEIGIEIGEKSLWGIGIGRAAIHLIAKYAFDELGLRRLELEVFDFNKRAIRCYKACGFKIEGTHRSALYRHGRWHDIHVMGLLSGEWEGPC